METTQPVKRPAQPIAHLSAISPTVGDGLNGVINLTNTILVEFPKTKIIGVVTCPEVQTPSLRNPSGGMAYVIAIVIQMASQGELDRLVKWSGQQAPGANLRPVS